MNSCRYCGAEYEIDESPYDDVCPDCIEREEDGPEPAPAPTLDKMLDDERSEVFALDLHRGDVVVLTYPEGTSEALQVLRTIASPYGDPVGIGIIWAPLFDLHGGTFVDDERAAELRAEGFHIALGMESRGLLRTDSIVEIVGANIRR